ncbi:NUDIX hydrolase [Allorhodopirellula heiligendammensis]|uniref:Nudix hydrolase n=1 Tax=Allorhodopirellula heiligendammensis TaxID=2714739 RepID=A0A5C6BX28_9BACT|nr:NUDIX domain-containing protein [Allorhodopirellula heiligendammensis]TWU16860.1 Nudix hydrolase [Allorhodopirellula heiligendammensis]|tara:strand:+ start:1106 stop:1570 length:465 start_codon:yes stop_codon:yes gene_type:complete
MSISNSVRPPIAPRQNRKRGVIGVIFRDDRLLIIRRSLTVNAPGKLCLPGGGIESGESEEEALVREMQEEIAVDVEPVRLCHRSVTPWGTRLAWWISEIQGDVEPVANPDEVAEIHWMTPRDIATARNVLPSLPEFIAQWRAGHIDLPWNAPSE